jgi:transcriptional regulator with XRE-family HTH domain
MRKTRGLKQQDLSEMAGITSRTLTDIELGKGNPSYATIKKLLDILGYKLVPTSTRVSVM